MSSSLRNRSLTKLTFSSVREFRGLPLPESLLTAQVSLNFLGSLLVLLFTHHLLGNSFVNSTALYFIN